MRATSAILSRLRAPATAKAVLFGLCHVRGGVIRATLPGGQTLILGDDDAASVSLKINDYRFAGRVVFNGDIGTIASIDLEEQEVVVQFAGRGVTYDYADLSELALALPGR